MPESDTNLSERGARVRVAPPLIFVSSGLSGLLLQWWIGLPVIPALGRLRLLLGLGLFGAGLFLIVLAGIRFQATGQKPEPWKPSPSLITVGIYRYTRNPMYVAMALWQCAVGVIAGSTGIVGATVVSLVFVYRLAIAPEEAYLAHKFRDAYFDYCRRTPRWI